MKRIVVRGPALSRSGYGEQTRFALRSLRKHEHEKFDIYLINLNWGKTGWIPEDTEERRWIDTLIIKTAQFIESKGTFDASLQVTIPNEWEPLAPVNIGYTAGTESTKISPEWFQKILEMDSVIVPSHHSKASFENTTFDVKNEQTGEVHNNFKCSDETPITVVNFPVREYEPAKMEGLDFDTDFNFLTVAQWGPRKNIKDTITWFVEEFVDQEVGLVLKVSTKCDSIIDRHYTKKRIKNILENYPDRKCKVYLLHGSLTEEEMTAVYTHPKIKALVSVSHGEGFGLPIFEAAHNGLPVVCPAWSGQCDFMFAPKKDKKGKVKNKAHFTKVAYDIKPVSDKDIWEPIITKGSMWCYPSQGSFKMKLREVFKNYDRCKKQAKTLQKHILKNFKAEDKYDEIVKVVTDCLPETPQEEVFVI